MTIFLQIWKQCDKQLASSFWRIKYTLFPDFEQKLVNYFFRFIALLFNPVDLTILFDPNFNFAKISKF
jgi:hypothetical protein